MLEQTYKIDEYDITSTEEIDKFMDELFLKTVIEKFKGMESDFRDTLLRNEVIF
jgi:hypothetical protein